MAEQPSSKYYYFRPDEFLIMTSTPFSFNVNNVSEADFAIAFKQVFLAFAEKLPLDTDIQTLLTTTEFTREITVRVPDGDLALGIAANSDLSLVLGQFNAPALVSDEDEQIARDVRGTQMLSVVWAIMEAMGQDQGFNSSEFSLVGVTPNWLTSGAPSGEGSSCGPGGRPVAVAPSVVDNDTGRAPQDADAVWRTFGFPDVRTDRPRRPSKAKVVILDTLPLEDELENARTHPEWPNKNPVLRSLLEVNPATERLTTTYLPDRWSSKLEDEKMGNHVRDHKYPLSDHGLFIAGIIHSIAPEIPLHIIQVLNSWGVGSYLTLAWGLFTALTEHKTHLKDVKINLSLVLTIPRPGSRQPANDFAWAEFPNDRKVADPLIYLMLRFIEYLCDELVRGGAELFAAAGNDGHANDEKHPMVRFPAALDGVLGVMAMDADGEIAEYSNGPEGPLELQVNFGGEIEQIPNTSIFQAKSDKSFLGVYTRDAFPDGTPNANGWAWWSGTSFATGLVTGIAASKDT